MAWKTARFYEHVGSSRARLSRSMYQRITTALSSSGYFDALHKGRIEIEYCVKARISNYVKHEKKKLVIRLVYFFFSRKRIDSCRFTRYDSSV